MKTHYSNCSIYAQPSFTKSGMAVRFKIGQWSEINWLQIKKSVPLYIMHLSNQKNSRIAFLNQSFFAFRLALSTHNFPTLTKIHHLLCSFGIYCSSPIYPIDSNRLHSLRVWYIFCLHLQVEQQRENEHISLPQIMIG